MACRSRRVLAKCGEEAAKFTQTLSELVSENLPKILDSVYYPNGIDPIFLNDCMSYREGNAFEAFI